MWHSAGCCTGRTDEGESGHTSRPVRRTHKDSLHTTGFQRIGICAHYNTSKPFYASATCSLYTHFQQKSWIAPSRFLTATWLETNQASISLHFPVFHFTMKSFDTGSFPSVTSLAFAASFFSKSVTFPALSFRSCTFSYEYTITPSVRKLGVNFSSISFSTLPLLVVSAYTWKTLSSWSTVLYNCRHEVLSC